MDLKIMQVLMPEKKRRYTIKGQPIIEIEANKKNNGYWYILTS